MNFYEYQVTIFCYFHYFNYFNLLCFYFYVILRTDKLLNNYKIHVML